MMRRFSPLSRRDPNTMDLAGDGDEMVFLEDVEAAFGITLAQGDVDDLYTLGDLEALVGRKSGGTPPRAEIWPRLAALARMHAAARCAPDHDTTFLAKHAHNRRTTDG